MDISFCGSTNEMYPERNWLLVVREFSKTDIAENALQNEDLDIVMILHSH